VNLTEFAELLNVSKMTVSRGCKTGRLRDTVVRDAKGRAVGVTDPELAKAEWAANSDYTDAPNAPTARLKTPRAKLDEWGDPVDETPAEEMPSDGTISGAAERQKHWQAKIAELKFKEAARELVPVADVKREWTEILSQTRTKLLGIPTRVRQAIPTLTNDQVVLVEALVREALEDLVEAEQP
jgi:hypothetical protein